MNNLKIPKQVRNDIFYLFFVNLTILLSIFIFLAKTNTVYADFTFTLSKHEFNDEEEIELNTSLDLQGQNNKNYYLEGAFKKEADSNYFGQTWNETSWIKYTSDTTNLKQITTNTQGAWSGIIKVKIDKENNLYTGGGAYTLRLKRFTLTGSSNNWSDNTETISIVASPAVSAPAPLPVPTHTPTPTPSPTPQPEPSSYFLTSNPPTKITNNDGTSIGVHLNLPANPNTNFYIKGAFKKSDGSNYFGITKINNEWIKNNETYTKQVLITTNSSGAWDGNIFIKPDYTDSGFNGVGEYTFKIARYSDTGSGPIWSNESVIILNPQSTPSPTPSATSILTTAKPEPTLTNTYVNSTQQTSTKSSDLSEPLFDLQSSPSSLGISTLGATPSNTYIKNDKLSNSVGGKSLFITGSIMIIVSVIWIFYPKLKWVQKTYLSNLFKHE